MDWLIIGKVVVFGLIAAWVVYVATTEQDNETLEITWRPWVRRLLDRWRART